MFGTLLIAVVALPLWLYIPGMLLSWALLAHDDTLEWHYERVVISVLCSGWLALLLASSGVFSLWLHLVVLLVGCAPLAWLALQRRRRQSQQPAGRNRWELAALSIIGLIALLLVLRPFEVVLGARDAAVYANAGFAIAHTGSLVQYDPLLASLGQQAQSTYAPIREPAEQALSNFLGVQHPERFIATRLYTAGFMINEGDMPQGRIVPQHLHLFPAWIALLTSALGRYGGLFAPGLMGVLGAWSVGMLGRRLAGAWVGALAFVLLALNSVQIWFARYPTSETTAQFFIFAALYCFAKFQLLAAQRNTSTAAMNNRWPLVVYAALAGVAVGQVALTRIDWFLSIGPLLLYLLYCAISRRWHSGQTAMALGLGAMLLHAALHIVFIARAYFFDTAFARLQDYAITSYLAQPFITPLLREVYHTTNRSPFKDPARLWRELALLLLLLGLLLALWRWPQPLRWLETQARRGSRLLAGGAAVAILLLAGYSYLIRPQILTPALLAQLPGCVLPQRWQAGDACLTLQGYIGAPIALPPPPPGLDEKYVIPLANFVRMGWYLSPLGVVLGVCGFALWWQRGLNRASWLFLVIGFLGTFFFVRDTYGTSDQSYIYILRRFVPIAYPAFSLGMAYALVALAAPWAWAGQSVIARRGPLFVSGGLTLLLVAFFGWTGRPIYRHVEYQGALQELQQVAAQFAPGDVLLLRGGAPSYGQARDIPDLVATPLRFTFGLNALPVKSSNPSAYSGPLAEQVRRWQGEGRAVYLVLSASGGSFALPGFALEPAGRFELHLPEYEQLTNQKPRNVALLNLSFAIYRLKEGTAGQIATLDRPLQTTDFAAQVRGFYLPESNPQPASSAADLPTAADYAWTDGDALLRIGWQPGTAPDELVLEVAAGKRPAHLGTARLCLSFAPEPLPWPAAAANFVPLGCVQVGEQAAAHRLVLDSSSLPAAASGSALLRLESDAWIPAAEDASQHDQRPLGIQFVALR